MSRVFRTISTTADSGAGSLREAITAGSVPNIAFASALAGGTFNKASQLNYAGNDLILQGAVTPDAPVVTRRAFRRGLIRRGQTRPPRDLPQTRPKFTGYELSISGSRFQVRYIDFYSDVTLGASGRAFMVRRPDASIATPIVGGVIESCDFYGTEETGFNLDGVYEDIRVSDCNFYATDWAIYPKCAHLASTSFLVDGQFVRYMPDTDRASVFTRCTFLGWQRVPLITGGVHFFYDCDFYISATGGPHIAGGRAAFIRCRFHSMDQPSGAPYWYYQDGPWPIVVMPYLGNVDISEPRDSLPLPDSVYTEGCTWDGVPKTTEQLVWEWVTFGDGTYPVRPVVHPDIFRLTPFPGAL